MARSVGLSNIGLQWLSTSWAWLPVEIVIALTIAFAVRWLLATWFRRRAARVS